MQLTTPFQGRIAALCVRPRSVYKQIDLIDCFDHVRDAYTFSGDIPIIAHPPCAQWSKLKAFSTDNQREKDLAMFCLERIQVNGGILEHPEGSSFFKYAGIKPTISIDQHWFGFPCRKRTWLYFSQCIPDAVPLSFNAYQKKFGQLTMPQRSFTTMQLAEWFISSIRNSYLK